MKIEAHILLLLALGMTSTALSQEPPVSSVPVKATPRGDQWFRAGQECRKDQENCERSCAAGNVYACLSIVGKYLSKDKFNAEQAKSYSERSCSTGDSLVCLDAAWLFFYPPDKKTKSLPEQAKRLFQLACEKGDARGCDFAKKIDSGDMPIGEKDSKLQPSFPGPACDTTAASNATAIGPVEPVLLTPIEVNEQPKLIGRREPIYPLIMRTAGKEGRVELVIVVDEKGVVTGESVLVGSDTEFNQSAQTAVSHWTYRPAIRCGVPVKSLKFVTVIFTLH